MKVTRCPPVCRYFRRLQNRYAQDPVTPADGGGGGEASLEYPITCINLLRLNEQRRNEHMLTEKFDEVWAP